MDKKTEEKLSLSFKNEAGIPALSFMKQVIGILESQGFTINYIGDKHIYSTIFYDTYYKIKFILRHQDVCRAELNDFIRRRFALSNIEFANRFRYKFIGNSTDINLGYKKYKNYSTHRMFYYIKH